MYCPFCQLEETKVVDSRLTDEGTKVRRRRECVACRERFTTFEVVELSMPRVVKRDGRRCGFDEEKMRRGMLKALEKRPVAIGDIDRAVVRVIHALQVLGEREVSTNTLGDMVMTELQQLDQVAYVRFASIYRSFEDVSEFHVEIQRLQELNDDG